MSARQTLSEINRITRALIELGLCNDQNFPVSDENTGGSFEITVHNRQALTKALKNVGYREIYYELLKEKCFNVLMVDGALLAFRYRFQNDSIAEHNLTYFPSPDLDQFQNEPDIYLDDLVYADIVARNIVAFPIRFDFSNDSGKYVEVRHPYSHLTLGQFKNCRIPVSAPVSPSDFCQFILRNFYNTAFTAYSDRIPTGEFRFERTISLMESELPHLAVLHQ